MQTAGIVFPSITEKTCIHQIIVLKYIVIIGYARQGILSPICNVTALRIGTQTQNDRFT